MSVIDEIIERVDSLPLDMRIELVEKLIHNLQLDELNVEQEWLALAEKRLEEVKSGKVDTISMDSVIREARERYSK